MGQHIAIYDYNGRLIGFWDDLMGDEPYNSEDARMLIENYKNQFMGDVDEFNPVYGPGLNDEVDYSYPINDYGGGVVNNVSTGNSKLDAFLDGLNPGWDKQPVSDYNPFMKFGKMIFDVLNEAIYGDVSDAYNIGYNLKPYVEIIGQGIVGTEVSKIIFSQKDMSFNDKLGLFRTVNNLINQGKYDDNSFINSYVNENGVITGNISGYGSRVGYVSGENLPYWYYSKSLKNVGIGGWMKSRYGNYSIKKRV